MGYEVKAVLNGLRNNRNHLGRKRNSSYPTIHYNKRLRKESNFHGLPTSSDSRTSTSPYSRRPPSCSRSPPVYAK